MVGGPSSSVPGPCECLRAFYVSAPNGSAIMRDDMCPFVTISRPNPRPCTNTRGDP